MSEKNKVITIRFKTKNADKYIREVIEAGSGLARELEALTSRRQRDDGDGRDLATRIQMVPIYPANHIDINLILKE